MTEKTVVVDRSPRWVPARDRVAALCAELVPGGRPGAVRRLAGGISADIHALDVIAPSGARRRFVLRCYGAEVLAHDPVVGEREWQVLTALVGSRIPAPHPIWVDRDGHFFGRPSLVMTRLTGRGVLDPLDMDGWIHQLARELAAIHRLPATGQAWSSLEDIDVLCQQRVVASATSPRIAGHAVAVAVWAGLRRAWPNVQRVEPGLLHGDYWAGNTMWSRGRLSGVVDWESACRGSPGYDVGYCHLDLALCHGRGVADRFVSAYEAETGRSVPDLAVWDLLAAGGAVLHGAAAWLPGWHAFGLADLTAETVGRRLHAFIEDRLGHV